MRWPWSRRQKEDEHPWVEGSADASLGALREEFFRDFCHRPGESFLAQIQDEAPELVAWLNSDEPEARSFVTLAVDGLRRGVPFWEREGIEAYREGGPPPEGTLDALGALAAVTGMPIRLFFEPSPGAGMKVWEFEPRGA